MLHSRLPVISYLHFFHHLLAEGADFSRGSDDHVFWALVLARDTVEKTTVILEVHAEVCLRRHKKALIISAILFTISAAQQVHSVHRVRHNSAKGDLNGIKQTHPSSGLYCNAFWSMNYSTTRPVSRTRVLSVQRVQSQISHLNLPVLTLDCNYTKMQTAYWKKRASQFLTVFQISWVLFCR